MSTPTTVAVVAGTFSLVTSLVTLALQQRDRRRAERRADAPAEREELNRQHMVRLQAEIEASGRERDAQRDYEYDARKRLYEEIQPLFFQLSETASGTFDSIRHLQGFRGFRLMDRVDAPMTINTTYRLIAPLAIVRLIQYRLTAVDLRLDAALRAQYRMARELVRTFSRGEQIAAITPAIEYAWTENNRQHLWSSTLEVVAEGLTIADGTRPARCMTYPEFEARYLHDHELREATLPVRQWLCGATPRTKPVLWRLLIVQAYLTRALTDMIEKGEDRPASLAPAQAERIFNWQTKQPLPPELSAAAARAAAETYMRSRLAALGLQTRVVQG
jgi:hypothetical protein